ERFHRRLLAAAVRADGEATEGRSAHVDIVIIGAGATGVELAAEIRQTTRTHAVYGLDKLDPARDIRLTLLEAAPRILPQLGERIARRRPSFSASWASPCARASASSPSTRRACTPPTARRFTPI